MNGNLTIPKLFLVFRNPNALEYIFPLKKNRFDFQTKPRLRLCSEAQEIIETIKMQWRRCSRRRYRRAPGIREPKPRSFLLVLLSRWAQG